MHKLEGGLDMSPLYLKILEKASHNDLNLNDELKLEGRKKSV